MSRYLHRLAGDTPLLRAMNYQAALSAFGEGIFLTGSAVYFTKVVGLTASQVGLGLSLGMFAAFALSMPLGRLADRIGTKNAWLIGSAIDVLLFIAWFFTASFAAFIALAVAVEVTGSFLRSGRNAYRLQVFPRDQRVRSMAFYRAFRNVGYTLGAGAGGIALAVGTEPVIRAIPLVSALVLVANVIYIVPMPRVEAPTPARPSPGSATKPAKLTSVLKNRGFVAMNALDGVLMTHQTLLNVVIPLWLVTETDAPPVLLAWLFGTNTVMAVFLQVAAARSVVDVDTALRAQVRGAILFIASCAIIAITHDTTGWVTIALVWIGHVTVTGAELFQAGGEWGLLAELSDPDRVAEYQGAAEFGRTLPYAAAPAVYTWLATHWGAAGWAVIAAIVAGAAVLIHPAARAAQRYLDGLTMDNGARGHSQ